MTTQQKITPHLWFDEEAVAAAHFYTSLLPNSAVTNITTLHDTPSGDCDTVSFTLAGQEFMAISAGPLFKFNPSISFMINFDPAQDPEASTRIDTVWEKLLDGGTALMPLDKYPFSARYGWVQDKYGLSWQLILTNPEGEIRPVIIPSLLFVGDLCGQAEAASDYYLSVFKESARGQLVHYPVGMEPEKAGTIMFSDFHLYGHWFTAMDSARQHNFAFNEATSLIVKCETQAEIDYYWEKLSAVPEAEQCGWCKDQFGVSWQVTPTIIDEIMKHGSKEQIARVTQAFLPMKKFDIAALQRAFEAS